MSDFGCVVNVDKPVGKSSFAVVSYVRKLSKIRKVGHAGTLDPSASGVLIVVIGRATKQVESLMGLSKEYIGTIQFGYETDSYDSAGKVIAEYPLQKIDSAVILTALQDFRGEIVQVPPVYSALKYKGRPYYVYARRGEPVTPEPRTVHVHDIVLESYKNGVAIVKISCSKGTYIRSIAHDLGKKLGCGGVLCGLTRTKVGSYIIDDAVTWNQLPDHVAKIVQN